MTAAFDRDDDEAFFIQRVYGAEGDAMEIQVKEGSPAKSLDWTDIVAVLKGAVLAFVPAVGVFLKSVDWTNLDFSAANWEVLLAALVSVLMNVARKWFFNTKVVVRKEI